MKTYRVKSRFVITDGERGRREFTPGSTVTSADLYPFEAENLRNLSEITAPTAPPEPAPEGKP